VDEVYHEDSNDYYFYSGKNLELESNHTSQVSSSPTSCLSATAFYTNRPLSANSPFSADRPRELSFKRPFANRHVRDLVPQDSRTALGWRNKMQVFFLALLDTSGIGPMINRHYIPKGATSLMAVQVYHHRWCFSIQ
jgi:hypothetical protein